MRAVGLFSGIGGLELGLASAGVHTELACEYWDPAAEVLRRRFPTTRVVGDIRELRSIPVVDVVVAGFPCTDLSQVGRTRGIDGDESGLIREIFRLVRRTPPTWLVLENVPNMLSLHGGAPIRQVTEWLEGDGWNWAYRTVDSQYFGVPQRRRRVILVASRSEDPRQVLFADDAGGKGSTSPRAHGFYWTEGNRGLGWGDDVVPTLKGGSKLGIPSPPAVWRRTAGAGRAIVRPLIEVGEQLQGFDPGWTAGTDRLGHRWKMVGNAVSVPVAGWVGGRLVEPGETLQASRAFDAHGRWPTSASSVADDRQAWQLSEAPLAVPRVTISKLMGERWEPLSFKATKGFHGRLSRARLRAGGPEFRLALSQHLEVMALA